jgi:predicted protein tyrosine phosphatase
MMVDPRSRTLEERIARIETDFAKLGAVTEAFMNVQREKIARLEAFVDAWDEFELWAIYCVEGIGECSDEAADPIHDKISATRDTIDWKPRP